MVREEEQAFINSVNTIKFFQGKNKKSLKTTVKFREDYVHTF